MTNFDRIKDMTAEEMADFLERVETVGLLEDSAAYPEASHLLYWLESEVKQHGLD